MSRCAGMKMVPILCLLACLVPWQVWAATPSLEWRLDEMFQSTEEFLQARSSLEQRVDKIAGCRGRLGVSAAELKRCLDLGAGLRRDYFKVLAYASLSLDKDLRIAAGQQVRAETTQVGVKIAAATAWVRPELLSLGKDRVEEMLAADAGLAPYAMFLRDTVRLAEHTLAPEQEELLSQVGLFAGKFEEVYEQLSISDLPYPTVNLAGLGEVTLDQTAYVRLRTASDRALREQVFHTFWSAFATYQNTFGTLLNAEVQKNWFFAKSHKYPTTLAASFAAPNLPESVYTSLIHEVRANLPVLHRALRLRQRLLGLETQRYHDIYASIVPEVEMSYPWQEAKPILLQALAPLGDQYLDVLAQGLDSWIDVYPSPGKQNGAYSAGIWYEGHPWVLMNYNGSYGSLSTIAHEMGHAMHSWLSNQHQPFATARYDGFLAEIASTFNEVLLQEHLLANESDRQKQLFLLGSYLERVRQTVFRQTMFAELQLEIHRRAEQGQSLTGEAMSELYLQLLRDYHGQDQGVMEIEPLYQVEWAYIPHFYRGYYVYQYATGIIAATALAEQVMTGDPAAVERYLTMLSSGSSDYPIELLRAAGADLTTSEPFDIAFAAISRALDRIEALLAEQAEE